MIKKQETNGKMSKRARTEKKKFPIFFYFLVILQAFFSLSFYMVTPLITKYLVNIGSTLAIAGLLSGILSYVCLVLRPFSGFLADRTDAKRILLISLSIFGVSVILYGCTENIVVFAILRILSGVSFSFGSTTIFAFAGSYMPKERIGEGVGYLGMGNIVASAIGPMLGSFLAGHFTYQACFAVAGIFSVFPALILLAITTRQGSQSTAAALKSVQTEKSCGGCKKKIKAGELFAAELIPIAVLASLFSYTNSTMSNFLLLFADSRGIPSAALYFTLLAVFLVLLRPLSGRLNDRYGLKYILIPGYILTMAGVAIIMNAEYLWMLLLATFFMAFGQGGGQPAVQAECMKRLGEGRSGVATSTYYIFNDIAQGLAPTIGGYVAGKWGYLPVFGVCIVLFGMGLIFYLFYSAGFKSHRTADF